MNQPPTTFQLASLAATIWAAKTGTEDELSWENAVKCGYHIWQAAEAKLDRRNPPYPPMPTVSYLSPTTQE